MSPELRARPETPPPRTAEPLPCHCCGFRADDERLLADVGGRHLPVCSICDAALHLQDADWQLYDLAWIPEIDQRAVSHLARTALVADAIADTKPPEGKKEFGEEVDGYLRRCGPGGELPREVFDFAVRAGAGIVSSGLRGRAQHLRAMLGVAGPAEIVSFLANLPAPSQASVLAGLRVIPRGLFESTVRAWVEGGSPYAEIDGERLHRVNGFIDA